MTVFKCKMCGGALKIENGESVVTCEYCDTKQTVPHVDNEMKIKLFSRANRLRTACQFDSARNVYEDIIKNFPEEAEAYWGLILCKYGIEYVDDPQTGRKIPTCHRSSFESVMDDSDFEQTLENADSVARKVYREEAKKIEEIRKGILEVSSKEEPFDIFICYKETDENGERTVDSVIAQDIYDMLTENGYRVFFSRVTLEDKLGQAYEPYIFAALNSAKIMLAVGTDYEYYDAAWVKNEWSRYLELISKGEKKVLIPCYKDLDAYDIPKQFRHLQAQDMGKVGAMQDLLRGIKKIFPKGTPTEPNTVFQVAANTQVTQNMVQPLLTRVFMFLEDGDFASADQYCEKILDIAPKCAEAYLGKALAELNLKNIQSICDINSVRVENMPNIQKAMNFGDDEFKKKIIPILETNKKYFQIEQDKVNRELYKQNWLSNALKTREEMYKAYKQEIGILTKQFDIKENEINQWYQGEIAFLDERDIPFLNSQLKEKKFLISNLKVFDFSKKVRLQQEIEELNAKIDKAQDQISKLKKQQADELKEIADVRYDTIQSNKKEIFEHMKSQYPIPEKPDDFEGSIADKIYAIVISNYSAFSFSAITNCFNMEDMDKQIEMTLKALIRQKKIVRINGIGYVGADIANIYY